MKKNRNKGFTLGELLIVVAIIGVLVAISIPIFTSQLEKAREATDAANIRSQYAEVMAEAITDGGYVNGKDMFGAVELKQKKNEWQSTGLKENLEGVYGKVVGDYPKAGGTAWVEYKNDQVILHYGDGSGNAGGSTGGSSTGGSTGGSSTGGSTGGSSTGGSTGGSSAGGSTGGSSASGSTGGSSASGSTGGGSGTSTDPQFAYDNVNGKSYEWPADAKTVDVKTGEIISHDGKLYISATTRTWDMSQWWYTTPDKQQGDFYVINNKPAQTDADLKKPWQGSDKTALVNLSIGDLYQDLDNNYYVYRGGSSINTPPSRNSNDWIRVLIK